MPWVRVVFPRFPFFLFYQPIRLQGVAGRLNALKQGKADVEAREPA